VQTGKKELLFDASHAKHSPPKARPLAEQDERESQKLWHDVTEAVKRRDQEVATDAKAKVEDMQREETAKRHADGLEWKPQLFRAIHAGLNGAGEGEEDLEWIINAKVSVSSPDEDRHELTNISDAKSPDEIAQQVLAIHAILPGQKPEHRFDLPSRPKAHEQSTQPTEQPLTPHGHSFTKRLYLSKLLCNPAPRTTLRPSKPLPNHLSHIYLRSHHRQSLPNPKPDSRKPGLSCSTRSPLLAV
jgi:hypothetical protein